MKLTKVSLDIGLSKPLRVLHVSDTHVILADERDNERKRALAVARRRAYGIETSTVMSRFEEALSYGRSHCDLMVHTGDMIDFVSAPGLDYLRTKLSENHIFFAVGNHEYSQYVGEAKEDLAYKALSHEAIQAACPEPLEVASRIVGGVNFVALDNNYYWFTEEHLRRVHEELDRGYPVILMMHNPIYTPGLYHHMMVDLKQSCAYLTGTPLELLEDFPPDRKLQQTSDPATFAFVEDIKRQPGIKAVLAGHLHFPWVDELCEGVPQIMAGGGFADEATELLIR